MNSDQTKRKTAKCACNVLDYLLSTCGSFNGFLPRLHKQNTASKAIQTGHSFSSHTYTIYSIHPDNGTSPSSTTATTDLSLLKFNNTCSLRIPQLIFSDWELITTSCSGKLDLNFSWMESCTKMAPYTPKNLVRTKLAINLTVTIMPALTRFICFSAIYQ